MVRTSIDIGTNSVKLLIGDVRDGQITPLVEKSTQTRLGHGLYETGHLSLDSMARTLEAIAGFMRQSGAMGSRSVRVVATSAMREAANSREFADQIHQLTGVPVEVVSGQKEAELSYAGVTDQIRNPEEPVLVIDVGGGSTELILGVGNSVRQFASLEMGSVRCFEKITVDDPPVEADLARAREFISGCVGAVGPDRWIRECGPVRCSVSTGGTAAAMTCMLLGESRVDRQIIDTTTLGINDIVEIRRMLWSVNLARRKKIPGIPRKKADILIMGVLIHEIVYELFGVEVCYPSTKGLRFGVLLEPEEQK
jgi:exopolyphosphatase/guanosine-5'-triphosphate,3'-diphosphate pyrophosphatase